MKETIIRYPRPLGFTYTAINTKNNKEERKRMEDTIINLYIERGMEMEGKRMSVQEMATFLQIPTQTLLMRINKGMERISGFFDGKEGKRAARVLWQNSVLKGLEIMALVDHQTRTLMAQQGAEYVPFLTGEVNRSLANLINAQKPIADLLKMLTEKNQINILINTDGDSSTSGKTYISPSQAIDIIQKEGITMYNNPTLIAAKEQELLGLPNVNARTQDLTSIGIKNRPNLSIDPIPISDSKALPGTEKRYEVHHEKVQDAEDFIA